MPIDRTEGDIYGCAYDTEGCQMPELMREIARYRAAITYALNTASFMPPKVIDALKVALEPPSTGHVPACDPDA